MKIHFLTSSTFKIDTARMFLEPAGIEVLPLSIYIPEIQADTNAEIARHSAVTAAKLLGHPVLREDHGFFFHAIPNFPGPYMAHIERTVPPEMVLRMLEGEDHRAHFVMSMAYAHPDGSVWECESRIDAFVGTEVRAGKKMFGWDSILGLAGDERYLCEYSQSELNKLSGENMRRLVEHLNEEKVQGEP